MHDSSADYTEKSACMELWSAANTVWHMKAMKAQVFLEARSKPNSSYPFYVSVFWL